MAVATSILFDANYLEPALVTAYELVRASKYIKCIYLVFLGNNSEEDAQARAAIGRFRSLFDNDVTIYATELVNSLPAFSSLHYNNSIIYKALIPSAIPSEPLLLNVDPGTLLGEDFPAFLAHVDQALHADAGDWVIAAHCMSAEAKNAAQLRGLPHNSLYPWGNTLLFNTTRYLTGNWHGRLLNNYLQHHSLLKAADEELIYLTAGEGELVPLPDGDKMHYPILGAAVLDGSAQALPASYADRSVLIKFGGSLKPWKYWVLDPNKAIYLRRRQLLQDLLPLSEIPLIEKNRSAALRQEWPLAFQQAYENYLRRSA